MNYYLYIENPSCDQLDMEKLVNLVTHRNQSKIAWILMNGFDMKNMPIAIEYESLTILNILDVYQEYTNIKSDNGHINARIMKYLYKYSEPGDIFVMITSNPYFITAFEAIEEEGRRLKLYTFDDELSLMKSDNKSYKFKNLEYTYFLDQHG